MPTADLDLPLGVPRLMSLYLYVSGSCNLACRHCWISPNYMPGGKGGQFIPIEYVKKAVQEALPLGLASVKLTGGEPTLHPQFRELLEFVSGAGLKIIVETNGTLIDPDLAQFIKDTCRNPFISVSLDGADALTHEALRLIPGSFERAVAGIKNLVALGVRPQLICTLYQGNYQQAVNVVDLAVELGCSSVKFNILQSSGRAEGMVKSEGLPVQKIIEIYRGLEKQRSPGVPIPVHFDIPIAFHPLKSLLNETIGNCQVLNILGVLSTGELSLCGIGVTVPELIYGHIAYNNIGDVWLNSTGLQELRGVIPDSFEGICGSCLHNSLCLGACVANSYHLTGKINSPYFFCSEAERFGLFPAARRAIE